MKLRIAKKKVEEIGELYLTLLFDPFYCNRPETPLLISRIHSKYGKYMSYWNRHHKRGKKNKKRK